MPKNPLRMTGPGHELKRCKPFGRVTLCLVTAFLISAELKYNFSYVIITFLLKSLRINNNPNYKLCPL